MLRKRGVFEEEAFRISRCTRATVMPSLAELAMMRSSTSVMFMTWLELEAGLEQKAAKDIDGDEGAEVADVGEVVDGGSAVVHADGVVLERAEGFDFAGKRIEEFERHNDVSP